MTGKKEFPVEPDQPFIVDTFQPGDAEGVSRLFRAVYGEGYPVKHVYNPESLIAAFNALENIPVVARTENGDIVGYVALFRSTPNPRLYEGGQGLVLPSYRNAGIGHKMNLYFRNVLAPTLEIDANFGEAVCNHVFMQKSVLAMGDVETALEIDLMPAEAYTKEGSASGRVAVIAVFRTLAPRPHTLYMPAVYQDTFQYIYSDFDDARTFAESRQSVPAGTETDYRLQVFDFANVARVAVFSAGDDFGTTIDTIEADLYTRNVLVIQVWLKLSWPWIGRLVDDLRGRGYFTGGPLPRWFDDDGILMQKIGLTPGWEGIHLYSDRAKKILQFVHKDWEEVTKKTYTR